MGSATEEVVHLAAAMHFCGFPSVVGTTWQMVDGDAPFLAQEFYKYMLTTNSRDWAEASCTGVECCNQSSEEERSWHRALGKLRAYWHLNCIMVSTFRRDDLHTHSYWTHLILDLKPDLVLIQ